MLSEDTEPVRRPRRDRRRTRNRERLLRAACELAAERGTAALTISAIARRAGLHQPGFYAHFASVEACLEEAMREIVEHQRTRDAERRAGIMTSFPPDPEADARQLAQSLRQMLDHAAFHVLFLRCRHEDSRLGRLAREQGDLAVREFGEHLWRIAERAGVAVHAEHLREFEHVARYIIDAVLNTVVELAARRTEDIDAIAGRLVRYHTAMVRAEIRRMLTAQREAPS
jgi:AcrR family transcriptional regulator